MQALDIWHARLDREGWPAEGELPRAERDRAVRIVRPRARRRWAAARWALRGVLARYLEQKPAAIALLIGARGKPSLAGGESLRFNLSHSEDLMVVAIAREDEVGVDVQRTGTRPAEFYDAWVRREAVAKCLGVGLGAPLPDTPVAATAFEAGDGFAAAVAVEGKAAPALRHFAADPTDLGWAPPSLSPGVSRCRRACGGPSSPRAAA